MVPAPTSMSSGCCRAQPREDQNSDSFRIKPWNVIDRSVRGSSSPQLAQHARRAQVLLEVQLDQIAGRRLELTDRLRRHRHLAERKRAAVARRGKERARLV